MFRLAVLAGMEITEAVSLPNFEYGNAIFSKSPSIRSLINEFCACRSEKKGFGPFAALATAFLALTGYSMFTKMRLQIEWRASITTTGPSPTGSRRDAMPSLRVAIDELDRAG